MAASDILREQLLALIDGHGAHLPFDAAVGDFPDDAINRLPPNVPYTPWHFEVNPQAMWVFDIETLLVGRLVAW
jgi:hypothetical protein